MNDTGKHMIMQLKKRWQLQLVAETMLYALGISFVAFAISSNLIVVLGFFFAVFLIVLVIKKPWQISVQYTSQFLDTTLDSMEDSTGLFLAPIEQLSNLAVLQRHMITERLQSDIDKVRPNVPLKRAFLVFMIFAIAAFLLHYFQVFEKFGSGITNATSKEIIVFQALDSTDIKKTMPIIIQQKLTTKYPAYTKLSDRTTTAMNVKAVEGSQIYWNIKFDITVDSVFIEHKTGTYAMKWNGKAYGHSMKLIDPGFYNFKFIATDGASYLSDLYALEVVKDAAPEIEIQNLKQFSTFDSSEDKRLLFNTVISDDFGIVDTYIVATVSKGEGESVKFREERLSFTTGFNKDSKKLNLSKTINLDALKMEAGDELYFYVTAVDAKQPIPNRSRSETYFAVIRDTVLNQFSVEGTMGADLMPDYFRSQRQLIIDTEKLIADKNKLSKSEFNAISNELGYDQKALRLKYGEFMGDEADSGIQVTQEVAIEAEQDEDDPLANYTHDHDGDNEHNLVDHDHEEEQAAEKAEDPLHDYLHNHDDPEESTLFTQSLKSKLRQAMNEMWDAELHLRLYTPEKSLPYQYRALKLIQEIKNSARIYVHRIGFDPPPIKEDKRLTGDIETVNTYQKAARVTTEDNFEAIRASIARITEVSGEKSALTEADRRLFISAGNELAVLAINNPSKYLRTLQRLKWLSEQKQTSDRDLLEIQSALLAALPAVTLNPKKEGLFENEINTLMLKELEIND